MKNKKYISDCQIDTDLEVLLPTDYINNISERINLYRELDNIDDEASLELFGKKIQDRFGEIPEETLELMNVVRLRWHAVQLGIEKVFIKNKTMVCYFISNPESDYYRSNTFSKVLSYVQRQSAKVKMKEDKNKLSLSIPGVNSVKKAIDVLLALNQ
jgi:transcription-repair coupling factor (superfamily II helicase)